MVAGRARVGTDPSTDGAGPGRYQAILLSFTRLVAERGYASTNFSDIARELGISKGTIVHHFGTKDRLFAAMHDRYMRRCLDDGRGIAGLLDPGAEQLAGLLFALVGYHVSERDATVACQREVATVAVREAFDESRGLRREYRDLLSGVIRTGVDAGQFRPADVDTTSLLTLGSTQWAWTWYRRDGRLRVDQIGAELVRLVLGGLSSGTVDVSALAAVDGRAATVAAAYLGVSSPGVELSAAR